MRQMIIVDQGVDVHAHFSLKENELLFKQIELVSEGNLNLIIPFGRRIKWRGFSCNIQILSYFQSG